MVKRDAYEEIRANVLREIEPQIVALRDRVISLTWSFDLLRAHMDILDDYVDRFPSIRVLKSFLESTRIDEDIMDNLNKLTAAYNDIQQEMPDEIKRAALARYHGIRKLTATQSDNGESLRVVVKSDLVDWHQHARKLIDMVIR